MVSLWASTGTLRGKTDGLVMVAIKDYAKWDGEWKPR